MNFMDVPGGVGRNSLHSLTPSDLLALDPSPNNASNQGKMNENGLWSNGGGGGGGVGTSGNTFELINNGGYLESGFHSNLSQQTPLSMPGDMDQDLGGGGGGAMMNDMMQDPIGGVPGDGVPGAGVGQMPVNAMFDWDEDAMDTGVGPMQQQQQPQPPPQAQDSGMIFTNDVLKQQQQQQPVPADVGDFLDLPSVKTVDYNSNQMTPNGPQMQQQPFVAHQQQQSCMIDQDDYMFNYQDEADLRELTALLNDRDLYLVEQAAVVVHQLSKKDVSKHVIMKSPELVASLIRIMAPSQAGPSANGFDRVNSVKCAAGVLHNISQHRAGLAIIYEQNGIQALVELLDSPVECLMFYAVTTLHNLLLHQEGSKVAVRQAGGIQKLVALLHRDNYKLLAIVTDCLQNIAFGNQESKTIILDCDGPAQLVRIMESSDYEKLLWTTSRVLKVLSICQRTKMEIVKCGGMQALAKHLESSSPRLVLNCLWTLRNLSDAAKNNLEPLIKILIAFLDNKDLNIVTCSAGILSNLTCTPEYKKVVYQTGGIGALLKTIESVGTINSDTAEPIVCTLRHLTSRHSESEAAQNQICQSQYLSIIVNLLNDSPSQPQQHQQVQRAPFNWSLAKAVMGLMRNLAFSPANRARLHDSGAISQLVNLLNKACNEMVVRHPDHDLIKALAIVPPIKVDSVALNDIIVLSIGSLNSMAKGDGANKMAIRHFNVVPTLVQLAKQNVDVKIQSVANEVLFELDTKDNCDGRMKMEQQLNHLHQHSPMMVATNPFLMNNGGGGGGPNVTSNMQLHGVHPHHQGVHNHHHQPPPHNHQLSPHPHHQQVWMNQMHHQ